MTIYLAFGLGVIVGGFVVVVFYLWYTIGDKVHKATYSGLEESRSIYQQEEDSQNDYDRNL